MKKKKDQNDGQIICKLRFKEAVASIFDYEEDGCHVVNCPERPMEQGTEISS